MNRDFFVEKVLRGEQVALADVANANAESELNAIYNEAESRRAAEAARLDEEKRRQSVLTELLTLDSEAEGLNADLLTLREEREATIRALDERESTINAKMRQTNLKFSEAFRFFNNGEPFDQHSPRTLKTVAWLRDQGANINVFW